MFEHVQFQSLRIHQLELGYTKKYRKPTKASAQFRVRLENTQNFTFKQMRIIGNVKIYVDLYVWETSG